MRLRLVPSDTSINFFGKSKYAIWLSILAVLISFVFYLINGLNYGIDFRGGTMLMIKTSNSSSVSEIRKSLNDLELGDTVVTKISDPKAQFSGGLVDDKRNIVNLRKLFFFLFRFPSVVAFFAHSAIPRTLGPRNR